MWRVREQDYHNVNIFEALARWVGCVSAPFLTALIKDACDRTTVQPNRPLFALENLALTVWRPTLDLASGVEREFCTPNILFVVAREHVEPLQHLTATFGSTHVIISPPLRAEAVVHWSSKGLSFFLQIEPTRKSTSKKGTKLAVTSKSEQRRCERLPYLQLRWQAARSPT